MGGSSSGAGTPDILYIAQIQTRGDNGANDEFVEFYNPMDRAVTFDSTWTVKARGASGGLATCASNPAVQRFSGAGEVIPSHGHLLYANNASPGPYNGTTPPDTTYTVGFTDAASVVLLHGTTVMDALCFYNDATTLSVLTGCATGYPCAGTPVPNPHDVNNPATNTDSSLERKPGGHGGNLNSTGDNAADFRTTAPSDPHNLATPPLP